MSHQSRLDAVIGTVERHNRQFHYPTKADGKIRTPAELFGENVFTLKALSVALPKPVFASFTRQMRGRQALDKVTADAVAHAVRIWAMDRGATHYTHWFQPQTDATAEKQDSFLNLKSHFTPLGEEVTAIDSFSGGQLLQSEPDASSFPSGGMRTTFEARGYTIWDTTSPMFIQPGPGNTSILYIPSVFISYNGEALDEKTVLLRSCEAISRAACDLLNLLEPVPQGVPPRYQRTYTTLGTEQEYFLVDRNLYALRQDLKVCGRTLLGSVPAKHQQMEDHYFGKIPSRVLATMSEAELELWKLGVPVKTRHNEVAPAQFEVAPIFEEAMIAVDHNLLTMDVLHRVAHRHKLKVLFHEKPFKGVNGSGKHCNWSLSTDRGDNLLDPTVKPEGNYRFLLFLVATLLGVYRHSGLLRAGIASASNEHRLGANEAPPGIISAFLGDQLTEVLNAVEEARPVKNFSQPTMQTVKLGGTVLDVKVSTLPEIARDLTDRNRTSPFAFTGNKFEFRAVGAKQSVSFPVTLVNAAVASALIEVTAALRKQTGDKPFPSDGDKLAVIKKYIAETRNVRFEGDNYSEAWAQEAAKRGLLNIKNCPDAFAQLLNPVNANMLTGTLQLFSKQELHSRHHILLEKYAKDLLIEANVLKTILNSQIIPAAFEYRRSVAEGAAHLTTCGAGADPEISALKAITPVLSAVQSGVQKLDEAINKVNAEHHDVEKHARAANAYILQAMDAVRKDVDLLETLVGDKYWPLPRYQELLFQI